MPVAAFNRNRSRPDGYANKCRACRKIDHADRGREPRYRLISLRSSAKKRGLTVTLTERDVAGLTLNQRCSYCGGELAATGSAIDRIDNSRGYELDNCRSACWHCNNARGALITAREFETLINERIARGWIGWPARYEEWEKK